MGSAAAVIVCLALILGLLSTVVPYGGWILLGMGMMAGLGLHRVCRTGLRSSIWFLAGTIALFASFYLQLRIPHPGPTDISHLLSSSDAIQVVIKGNIASLPRLTRGNKAQLWLQASAIAPIGDGKPITGRVYTTVPLEQAKSLHPGQHIQVSGSLYLPKPAANPGSFDFQNYLLQERSFAGLRGEQVQLLQDSKGWGWWQVQRRIVQAQQQGLGTPAGALVSAMVLGGRAVDLPYDVKDSFVRVGLAHALAASGFQTSLILGVVLAMTGRCSKRVQAAAGALALVTFVGLAGLQPAVLRAALMGFGGLVALVMQRQIRPLGALLVTAVILLLVNPLWVWDLGFQLSFLATIGLLVTVPALNRKLDWLPPTLVPLMTVPIAAYLWTLPLQLGAFGVLSPYSIPANLVTTPFISLISLGGMASALAAIVWPAAGSLLAWFLKYPTDWLIALVHGFNQLPGNSWAIGTISVGLVVGLYGLLSLANFHRWWQKRWWVALLIAVGLLLVPLGMGATATQVMILATSRHPIMVVRDRGRVLVIGSSDTQTAQFTLLPYLQKVGINQIDWAIAPNPPTAAGWFNIAQHFSMRYLVRPPELQASLQPRAAHPTSTSIVPLGLNQTVKVGATQINLVSMEPAIVQFTLHNQTWLWLDRLTPSQQKSLLTRPPLPQAQVLWWTGKAIAPDIVQQVKPTTAIASSVAIEAEVAHYFKQHHIPLFVTGDDGAIQWTPTHGFSPASDSE